MIRYIAAECPELWDEPPGDIINVNNGLLNVVTRELLPHSPEHLSSVRIPITYDPFAKCPEWDRFNAGIFPADSIQIAWEITYWLMNPDRTIQQAVLFQGEGSNGKSTYLEANRRAIGRGNTASMPLQRLEADRFAAAALFGKLANICPDLPSQGLTGTSVFKTITGGDYLQAEYKFKDSFSFRPYCKLIFSANRMPQSPDDSHAFFRRWTVIPFANQFDENDSRTLSQDVLLQKLTAPAELSGLLNRALDAGDQLRKERHFTIGPSIAEANTEFRRATDPFSVWLEANTVLAATGYILQTELRNKYAEVCTQAGRAAPSAKAITAMLRSIRPGVELKQKRLEKTNPWAYFGIAWMTEEKPPLDLNTSHWTDRYESFN